MSGEFSADWLARREPFDAEARSHALAGRLAAALPARPRLLELGAGTGSLLRWLAPLIGRDQAWTLLDRDEGLLAAALGQTAAWAAQRGWEADAGPGTLTLRGPAGTWRIGTRVADLGGGTDALPLSGQDGVVCSALLDLVSAAWARGLVARLAVPLLASMTVNGRDRFLPPHADDALLRRGFARHMRGDKGFGPAMGGAAPAVLARLLTRAGFVIHSASSDWLIPRSAGRMLTDMIEGHATAAAEALPAMVGRIAAWREGRLHAVAAGTLSLVIGHCDLLALPGTR